ncbi:MAG: Diaminopimelate epimerase [Thermoanaerobacterales bacterium 50_218]|nr:MAG: Diaminopimelate epimerase [Thermoanaerobacterales bacterium 50_218]HAA89259.1 diaminopimelate epimerase [Peptococcaceae bacterium]
MEFFKWQGLGNDFVILEDCQFAEEKLPGLARALCDRHFGIGADGMVLLFPGRRASLVMRIFNPDGSEAEMCGNALRCVAKYAFEKGLVGDPVVEVETKAGIKKARIILDGPEKGLVQVDMGEPVLERERIPVMGPPGTRVIEEELEVAGEKLEITAVSMGNPHCLLFVPDVQEAPVGQIGPLLEKHQLFPQRTNVEFVEVRSPQEIVVRVWERGVGETLACGTGACASAVGSFLCGKTGRSVRVRLPGGQLLIEWLPDNHVYMTGPAEEVFQGVLSEKFEQKLENLIQERRVQN